MYLCVIKNVINIVDIGIKTSNIKNTTRASIAKVPLDCAGGIARCIMPLALPDVTMYNHAKIKMYSAAQAAVIRKR